MDTSRILIGVLSYILGIGTGIIGNILMGRNLDSKNAKNIVLIVVTTIWSISMIVEIANPIYHTNPMVHALMGSIVGFFYTFNPKSNEPK